MKKDSNMSLALTYDNEFRWAYVWRSAEDSLLHTLLVAIGYCIIHLFFYWVANVPLDGNLRFDIWSLVTLPIFIFVINAVKYGQRLRTGRYSIVGDNLMVHEQYFSSTTELTIPISDITDIRRTPYIFHREGSWLERYAALYKPYSFIEITLDGQKFVLYSFARADELYNELRRRLQGNKQ